MKRLLWALPLLLAATGCGDKSADSKKSEPRVERASSGTVKAGRWRARLESPGGELGFILNLAAPGVEPPASIENGEERIAIERVERESGQIIFAIDHYDAVIEAKLDKSGSLVGAWTKTTSKGKSTLPFRAEHGDGPRFTPPTAPAATPGPPLDGSWSVTFKDDDGESAAVGIFQTEAHVASGTFLTATGDYRFLAGDYHGGVLRLSAFDGAHAFLFHAAVDDKGHMTGDFWSRDTYHTTFRGERLKKGDSDTLPDPFSEVTVTNKERKFRFAFPGLDGTVVKDTDERFAGKVVIVELFGTWCPNCNDAAPLLAEWHRRYRERGLEVVGLAYEFTGDRERDAKMVARHRDKYKIEFPLLLAGVSNKAEAAKTLPDLSAVKSYPTTIFIARDGKVARIHSGFTGPGTGEHYPKMVAEMETVIEGLLAAKR